MVNTVHSMIKHVSSLIQAQAVGLAFSVEKAIASSFVIPANMADKIGSLPQQYRDVIKATYQKSLFKSFDQGYQDSLSKDVAFFSNPLRDSCVLSFSVDIAPYSEGVDLKSDIEYALGKAYTAGYEMLKEDEQEDEQDETVTEVVAANGFPTMQNSDNIGQKDVIKHMEEYISKLSPIGQKVMRYELGIQYGGDDGGSNNGITSPLGMKKVEAAVDNIDDLELPAIQFNEDTVLSSMVGPYAVSLLCDNTINIIKSASIDSKEDCYVLMEHVVTEIDSMKDIGLVEAICNRLELKYTKDLTLNEVNAMADELAVKLTEACRLPGDYMFINSGSNYSLGFVFNKPSMVPIINAVEAKAKAQAASAGSLDIQPSIGSISTKIQKEIQNLAGVKSIKGSSLMEIKRVSPGVASYISKNISNYRNGKCTHQELATLLRAGSRDLVGMVFGEDGVGYYDKIGC